MASEFQYEPGVGSWQWSAAGAQLRVKTDAAGAVSDLAGIWSLDAFGVLLDGLSRSRLIRCLERGEGEVSCALGLSDGRRVQLIGTFTDKTRADGTLYQGEPNDAEAVKPGPTLVPAYQPIISLATGITAGFEALARWDGATTGTDALFEDPALATNMLIRGAEALSVWRKATGRDDLFVHVNLTARDLATGDMARLIETLRDGYDLPRGALKVELTEQAALRDMGRALEAVVAIKEAGAGLVLDDFGSGHSSFAWLADMPADGLKIDPDLTRRLGDTRTDHILEAITLLASRLEMVVTAEGVEKKSDIGQLRSLGFTYVQGFAFSRPLEEDAALVFLNENA